MCTPIETRGIFAYTSLQEYLYPLIQQKSIPQILLIIILTHTRTHTHAFAKVFMGPRRCRIENRQI